MPNDSETVTKTRNWSMWASTPDDLRRILVQIENSFIPLIDEHVEEATSYERARVAELTKDHADALERLASPEASSSQDMLELLQSQERRRAGTLATAETALADRETQAKVAAQIDLSVTTKTDQRRVTRTASGLSDYLDGKSIISAEFSAPSGSILHHSIRLSCDVNSGVDLRVSSREPQWTIAVFSEISNAINAGVPKTRFVRNLWFLLPLYGGSSLVAYLLIINAIARVVTGGGVFPDEYQGSAVLAWIVISTVTYLLATYLTLKLVPAFRVLQATEKPPSSALVRAVVGSAIALATGVLCNIIAAAITQGA
jgi:hypothetical protein